MTIIVLWVYVMVCVCSKVCCWQIQVPRQEPGPSPPPKQDPEILISTTSEQRFNLIFPGTKWCGSGSIASHYDDLGTLESTDVCCREHDYCSDSIEPGQSFHGLTNKDIYSKLHCDCDRRFYYCLKADDSKMSKLIGFLYFNTLNTQCYREDYPIIKCSRYYFKVCCWQILVPRQDPGPSPPPKQDPEILISTTSEQRFNLIFPGTKWCGSGYIASHYDDLGTLESTDVCCREHDSCPDFIEAGQSSHGLTNNDFYSKLHCDCDRRFYYCLKADDSKMSKLIGFLYFNTLNTQCYREDYPIIKCSQYYLGTRKCKTYELNENSKSKIYQFFDVPFF